jgi:hypothetical protein
MRRSENKLDGFQRSVNRIPGLVAGAFAVGSIVEFTRESIKLAGVAEGVEKAFKGINGANLGELRKATKNTVSDLELMKAAVNARNFEIPFSKLGSLFQFATKRASETGQEVNQLTQDIITGLGRKSPLILDNLGISAVKLKEKLGGVGLQSATTADITKALTEVIEEQEKAFGGTGDSAKTLGQDIQTLESNIDNLRVALGKKIANNGFLNVFLGGLNGIVTASNEIDDLKTKLREFKDFQEAFDASDGARIVQVEIAILNQELEKRNNLVKKQVGTILEAEGSELKLLNAYKRNIHFEHIRAGVLDALKKKKQDQIKEDNKLIVLNKSQQKVVDSLNLSLLRITASEGVLGTEYKRTEDRIKAYQKAIIDLKTSGIDPTHESLKNLNSELQNQLDQKGLKVSPIDIEKSNITDPKDMQHFQQVLQTTSEQLTGVDTQTKSYVETVGLLGSAFEAMGGNMVSTFQNIMTSGQLSFKAILQMIKKVIARLIAAAAAAAILAALLPGGSGKLQGAVSFGEKFKVLFSGLKGFAGGGRPPTNRPSIIGEKGPELFIPDSPGTVIPNHSISSNTMSAGLSVAVNLRGTFFQRGTDMVATINETVRSGIGASNIGTAKLI